MRHLPLWPWAGPETGTGGALSARRSPASTPGRIVRFIHKLTASSIWAIANLRPTRTVRRTASNCNGHGNASPDCERGKFW